MGSVATDVYITKEIIETYFPLTLVQKWLSYHQFGAELPLRCDMRGEKMDRPIVKFRT
jgi:hypothetical protein